MQNLTEINKIIPILKLNLKWSYQVLIYIQYWFCDFKESEQEIEEETEETEETNEDGNKKPLDKKGIKALYR